ncbi:unnamed protein product [Diamesa serratosioi]
MASKSKRKNNKAEDSDMDGSEKSYNSNANDDDAHSLSEVEQFYFDDDEDFGASSTQIQPSDKPLNNDDQIDLLNILKTHIKPMEYAGTTFNRTLKKIKWDEVKISGYTGPQLMNIFIRLIKPVKKIRTLLEVINDLQENDAKYKRATHLDFPKKPFSAFMYYQTENREKLTKSWQKKQGDTTKIPSLGNLAKYASEKFRELPEKKLAVYNDRFKKAFLEYQEKLESFYVAHPELRVVSKKKNKSEVKVNTPLNFFIQKFKLESETPLHRNDLMKNWREMSDLEKAPYIRAVAEDYESMKEKRISKEEQKILDKYNGIPIRPLHPFNEFIKDFQKSYSGDSKERFREASITWKNMNTEDKQKYFDKSEENTENFRMELEKYVSGFPAREREETWNKLRLSKKMKMTNLNDSLAKNGDSKTPAKVTAAPKPIAIVHKVPASPIKAKKVEESDDSSSRRQKKKHNNESEDEAEAARKRFKLEKEVTTDSDSKGSPKKKKKKDNKLEPLEYPSQTKQHYFLTHIYKGVLDKPEKINAAWMKLGKAEKAKIDDKVAENQKSYMKMVQAYIADGKDVDFFKKRVKESTAEQKKAISWCKNMASDSSSDSGADSDSS